MKSSIINRTYLGITIYDIKGEKRNEKTVLETPSDHQVISIFKQ